MDENDTDSLDYIINIDCANFSRRFAGVFSCNNLNDKTQLCHLLGLLCQRSCEGHDAALKICEQVQAIKKSRYRFSCLVDELSSVGSRSYLVALLETINSLVECARSVEERTRIRNELIGLKLLDIFKDISKDENNDQSTLKLLEQFHHSKLQDEQELRDTRGLDLSSHLDVFHAVWKQVIDTPSELTFLSVLQHLLQIDANDVIGDVIWNVIEKLVSGATLLVHKSEADRLASDGIRRLGKAAEAQRSFNRTASCDTSCHCHCHQPSGFDPQPVSMSPSDARKQKESTLSNVVLPTPPPPPPPPQGFFSPPPPPPPPGPVSPLSFGIGTPPATPASLASAKSRHKLRSLQWTKIPATRIGSSPNVWSRSSASRASTIPSSLDTFDFSQLECLFAVDLAQPSADRNGTDRKDAMTAEKRRKLEEVNLLDAKKSLNVNIFLRQFRASHSELVDYVRTAVPGCSHTSMDGIVSESSCIPVSIEMGVERLRGLHKILPETDEIEILKAYTGDGSRLGNAEKFYMELITLPDFRYRVDTMLVVAEFDQLVESIRPSIDAVVLTSRDLFENTLLHELLHIILSAGNFLNSGGYAGDAVGFKLSSLLKLTDTRGNKPGFTLLHFIALMVARKNPNILTLPTQMIYMKEASQYSIESLTSDVSALRNKVKSLSDHNNSTSDVNFTANVKIFTARARKELDNLERDLRQLETMRIRLAQFFCEEEKTFKLDECIKTFQEFFQKFQKAIQDNKEKSNAEEKATQRRRQQEGNHKTSVSDDLHTLRPSSFPSASLPADDTALRQFDLHAQKSAASRSISYSMASSGRTDRPASADIQTGTVADRRSRNNELLDSNNLMDFLRARPSSAVVDSTTGPDEALADFDRSGSVRHRRRLLRNGSVSFEAQADGRERSSVTNGNENQSRTEQSGGTSDKVEGRSERKSWREILRNVLSSAQGHASSDTLPTNRSRQNNCDVERRNRLQVATLGDTGHGDDAHSVGVNRTTLMTERKPSQSVGTRKYEDSFTTSAENTTANDSVTVNQNSDTESTSVKQSRITTSVSQEKTNTVPPSSEQTAVDRSQKDREMSSDKAETASTALDSWQLGRVFDENDDNQLGLKRSAALAAHRQRLNRGLRDSIEEISTEEIAAQHIASRMSQEERARDLYRCSRGTGEVETPQRDSLCAHANDTPLVSAVTIMHSTTTDNNLRPGAFPATSHTEHRYGGASTDIESTSIGSRDEGFESSHDNASQSNRSSACHDSTASSWIGIDAMRPGTPYDEVADDSYPTTDAKAGDEPESSSALFARSFDSLVVSHELVRNAQTFDIDIDMNTTLVADESQPTSQSLKQSTPKRNSKSSLLADLSARLSRPKKSSGVTPTRSAAEPKVPNRDPKSSRDSPFVRGSVTRTTMPASMPSANRRRVSEMLPISQTCATPAYDVDQQAPEPPRRTTSIGKPTHSTSDRLSRGLPSQPRRSDADSCTTPTLSSRAKSSHNGSAPRPNRELSAAAHHSLKTDAHNTLRDSLAIGSRLQEKSIQRTVIEKTPQRISQTREGNPSYTVAVGNYAHRTQRLSTFNTPQQVKSSRY